MVVPTTKSGHSSPSRSELVGIIQLGDVLPYPLDRSRKAGEVGPYVCRMAFSPAADGYPSLLFCVASVVILHVLILFLVDRRDA